MKISRATLGLAAEFAVASELGRRNVYAQPTLGLQKRTDLLIFGADNKLLKIEVKGKQGSDWPNCRGIFGENIMLVFVDFMNKGDLERPDFYVLTVEDWMEFVTQEINKRPEKKIRLERGVMIWTTELNNLGQPYKGIGVRPEHILKHKEKWNKIIHAVGQVEINQPI
jgi:hypothetical protein